MQSEIIHLANQLSPDGMAPLDDDAVLYSGEATVDRWQCHVPVLFVAYWESLPEVQRAIIYIMASMRANESATPSNS
ncbi:MAG: hypothetical protein AAGB04_00265 [Pseudomonadota bacterium]